ncbi:hypothetical protein L6452_32797 [Arctium lappa]|uniref:Uncharacterized protein n=1 Tax=Arctium lappa TaxID=4217 RepID=A0ACB8Z678_ARCLA|nr:hypothetical protein L6452_32797 [Arctium lappa]
MEVTNSKNKEVGGGRDVSVGESWDDVRVENREAEGGDLYGLMDDDNVFRWWEIWGGDVSNAYGGGGYKRKEE